MARPAHLGTWTRRDDHSKSVAPKYPHEAGPWDFDDDDYTLIAMLMDPILCAELLRQDPENHEYGGCFIVRPHQYTLNRSPDRWAGYPCARAVGKSVAICNRAMSNVFKRIKQGLLITGPEFIHIKPLTDNIESEFLSVRLVREFLDTRNGSTGFQKVPNFKATMKDGTWVEARIARLDGRGNKGAHVPDIIVEEAQEVTQAGWRELLPCLNQDSLDRDGNPDSTYSFFGVHTGARDSGFYDNTTNGTFSIFSVTRLQLESWGTEEKNKFKGQYGDTMSGDYRRNVYGEAGGATTALFNQARLLSCVDQNPESQYNRDEYAVQKINSSDFDTMGLPIEDVLNLPGGDYARVWAGADLGLMKSPTAIMIFSEETVGKQPRLKLIRRIELHQMRVKDIRGAIYAIFAHFGETLQGFGVDSTGLGLPIMQEIQDDPDAAPIVKERTHGFFFNAKVPVGVEAGFVSKDAYGNLKDQYGAAVTERINELTHQTEYVVTMMMIEASTRYLRKWVDSGYFLLPFDREILSDFQGDTQQRIKRITGQKTKPDAYHLLDACRAMSMTFTKDERLAAISQPTQVAVLDLAW